MRFTIFQESRKGAREVNQDRTAYTYSRETLLLVIADGMGGHIGGDIAAQIAVRLFIERFQQEAKPILLNPLKFMQETLLRAHAALGSYANQFSMLETPRTTCVAVVVQGGHAYWAHVGDSRFYLLRQGKLIASTKDHSKVQYLVDQGIIAPQDVVTHPDRNKIFSCFGGAAEPVIDLSRRMPLRQRRYPHPVHRRVVERVSAPRAVDDADVDADPDDGAADHARGRGARRRRWRQRVGDHRALGSRDARRPAVDDDRLARARLSSKRSSKVR